MRKRQRSRGIRRWQDRGWERARHSKTSRQVFVEDNITRKMIFPLQIPNSPAQAMLLIAHENAFKTLKTSLIPELIRNSHEALAPPYSEM